MRRPYTLVLPLGAQLPCAENTGVPSWRIMVTARCWEHCCKRPGRLCSVWRGVNWWCGPKSHAHLASPCLSSCYYWIMLNKELCFLRKSAQIPQGRKNLCDIATKSYSGPSLSSIVQPELCHPGRKLMSHPNSKVSWGSGARARSTQAALVTRSSPPA